MKSSINKNIQTGVSRKLRPRKHRRHVRSIQPRSGGPSALEFKYLSSRSALECALKSAMGLGFKRKRETRYDHRDDCQMPLLYTKRKDDRSFITESSRVKKEALEMRDFCRVYGKGVKVSEVK